MIHLRVLPMVDVCSICSICSVCTWAATYVGARYLRKLAVFRINHSATTTLPAQLRVPAFLFQLDRRSHCDAGLNFGPLSFSLLSQSPATMDGGGDPERAQALQQYKDKLLESREWEARLKALRMDIKGLQKEFETTEENIKALQSVGQIIGEVLKQLDEERCASFYTLIQRSHLLTHEQQS